MRAHLLLLLLVLLRDSSGFIIASFRSRAKENLIDLVRTGAPEGEILSAVKRTELLNPQALRGSLASPLLSNNWLMVWTTSDSIAGKQRPRLLQTRLPPEQLIDVDNGLVVNSETVLGLKNAVEATLEPVSRSEVAVKFEKFRLGPLSFPAPDSLRGRLDVTYLDESMRISRGDQGNVFILLSPNERKVANGAWIGWQQSWEGE